MMGGDGEAAGIIPRLCTEMFARIADSGVQAEVQCSYVEIYGQSEKLADLLLPEDEARMPLSVRRSADGRVVVQNATTVEVANADELRDAFVRALVTGSDHVPIGLVLEHA